jgi:hypothetical protein
MNTQTVDWRRLDIPNLPPPHFGGALAFNSKDQIVLLYGGVNSSSGYQADLWSSNSMRWEQRQTSARPAARFGTSLAWDEKQQAALLFGGFGEGELLGDTWLFNGTEWIQQDPLNSPSSRANACIAYDAAQGLTILFGGRASLGGKYLENLDETWAWDGKNWQQQFPTHIPPKRERAVLVYDRARQALLLFGGGAEGGLLDDTWIWDGVDWSEQKPINRPPARNNFGMAYHEGKQQIILFGGQSEKGIATDTWAWDGQDWTQLQTTQSPPPQVAYGARLAYFPDLESVVLYGVFREKKYLKDESFTMTERSEFWILDY